MKDPKRNPIHFILPLNCHHEFRQRHWSRLWLVLTLAIGLGTALTGRAQVTIYDNLGSPPYGSYGYFGVYSDGYTYKRGMQFTCSKTITLSTLELVLGEGYFAGAQSGTAMAQLMTDTNNTPATVLESWTSGALSGVPGDSSVQTFTSVQKPTLTAGQKYWVVVGDAPGSSLTGAWEFAATSPYGNTYVMWDNVSTGSATFFTLTAGYRTRIIGEAPPLLSITSTGTNTIVVSWPAYAAGAQLQSSTQLGATANWTATSQTPITNGNFLQVTLPVGSTSQFFRLVK